MNITGMDYNTQRDTLVMPEYGRGIQRMVAYAISLPSKAERQKCANTIVHTMELMQPQIRQNEGYKQKLWDQLAIMSNFQLDIDWPYDISNAKTIKIKPKPIPYPMKHIPVRHYGKMMFEAFEKLKEMPEGAERDKLTELVANQMRRDIMQWSHSSADIEKVAADLYHFTDGVIELDTANFRFAKIDIKETDKRRKKK